MAKSSKDRPPAGRMNPDLPRRRAGRPSLDQLVAGVRHGDRVALGKAITLAESTRPADRSLAGRIVEACLPYSGRSLRLGITGSPGVGKSTFIEALGLHVLEQNRRVAVLAIDPSSQRTHGSILGDKTRMERLGQRAEAFIRPSPTGQTLGGVARKTRETILLCEAAGFDTIIVETVGVGQSETAVHSMVDFFLLLLLPGAGDELQGIKRGIVEMSDLLAINKAEGANLSLARRSAQAYRNALHLFPPKYPHWTAPVHTCSALEGQGIPEIWEAILKFVEESRKIDFLQAHRREQAAFWLQETIHERLREAFDHHPAVLSARQEVEQLVLRGKITPAQGADRLFALFRTGPTAADRE